jgi:superfamily II DNA or RNA helicase
MERNYKIHETFSYGVVYLYSIPYETHKGRLKTGYTTINSENLSQQDIDQAAHNRIKQQTQTADIPYKLEYAELAITNDGDCFSDKDVHNVLIRSGYDRKSENVKNAHSEWFEITLDIGKNAIQAVKQGRTALTSEEKINSTQIEFQFRPNQLDAIEKTTKAIKKNRKKFLWNAKMRFGKTSAAMQVAKENKMQKVLIVTHRPSVSADWYEDFNKVLASDNYEYSSKDKGENIKILIQEKKKFVYFASLQDLRGAKRIVQDESNKSQAKGFEKNDEIFDTTWDMVIIDEAHEGTQSDLGESVFLNIPTNFTLVLSGTPFNIIHKHQEEEIYTWDYVMEQAEKLHWETRNPGVPNPYSELPALSIFTYDIDKFKNNIDITGGEFYDTLDKAFKFHEFFRVHKDEEGNDTDEFVHKNKVQKFLNLLVNDSLNTKFPYATEAYRNYNKHSLWLLPNRVKVIEAIEKLLKEHPVFGAGNFGIVNISGDNKDDEEDKDAKERVINAIKNHEYTITLTGQRLTTGASIPQWTAVFMMSDTSSATTYLQTAFRCQTPAKINGKIKTQGYVFDFAPDRTLKLVAEAVELNHKSGKINTKEQKEAMIQFLNFCPIITSDNSKMKSFDVDTMLLKLKEAIIDRVSRNGFDDPKLYNDKLLNLDGVAWKSFDDLKQIVGKSNKEKTNELKINDHGMDALTRKKGEAAETNQKKGVELTEEEKEALKQLREARKQKQTAISILRAVSIRMPMLVYGANVSYREDIDLQEFIDLVDDESWEEFMPEGLTKAKFQDFVQYYDEDVFKGVTKNIRAKAYDCDQLMPTERIQAIAEIFSTFKNPDKETVLTPWNVVNMHLTSAFGGHNFSSEQIDSKTGKPFWVSGKDIDTSIWEEEDTKILEINSKSGMYPLLAAYNVYSRKLKRNHKKSEEDIYQQLWREVLKNNIYVLCKSPMAKSITQRTLAGYDKSIETNIIYIEDLVSKLQQKEQYKDYKLQDELLAQFNLDKNMKFTAVVGNPPYQIMLSDNKMSRSIYPDFVRAAINISNIVSLIMPARWMSGENGPYRETQGFVDYMLSGSHIKSFTLYPDSSDVFSGVDIKGGVCHFVWDKDYSKDLVSYMLSEAGTCVTTEVPFKISDNIIVRFPQLTSIIQKISRNTSSDSMKTLVSSWNPFGFISDFFVKNNESVRRISEEKKDTNDYKVIGLLKGKRVYRYIPNDELKKNRKGADSWKVFVTRANGSGVFGEVFSTPMLGTPMLVCTDTFLQVGEFDNEYEAKSVLTYVKTKFFRAMVGVKKTAVFNYKDAFTFVPLQDFTPQSDIDWSKSIPEIDQQLYTKYGLDQKEIDFIESRVKPMT